jgi:hypothetical protein
MYLALHHFTNRVPLAYTTKPEQSHAVFPRLADESQGRVAGGALIYEPIAIFFNVNECLIMWYEVLNVLWNITERRGL